MNVAATGFLIGVILGNLLIGGLFGLIPFILGRKRELNGLGTAGLICSIIGNFLLTGLGPFIAVIFAIIILVKSR